MIENAEVNYGTALNIINDPNSKDKELRMARATIVALAEQGHRGALDLIVRSPKDYDIDVDALIESIADKDERIRCYKELFKSSESSAHRKYALKLLACGDPEYICLCDKDDAVPLLEDMDPEACPLNCYRSVLLRYAEAGRRRNKWVDHLIEKLEGCSDVTDLDGLNLSSLPGTMCESDRERLDAAIVRLWMSAGTEKLSRILLDELYWYSKLTSQEDMMHSAGMELLRRGAVLYLSSDELLRRLTGGDDRICDQGLLEDLIEASSEETVFSCLSLNYRLSKELRMDLAKKALESGSDRSRIAYAEQLSRSEDADHLEIVRQCLMVKKQSWEFRDMLCHSYDALAGERKDDPIALELYRC